MLRYDYRTRGRASSVLVVCIFAAAVVHAEGPPRPSYHITATVSLRPAQVSGVVEATFVNDSGKPIDELVLLLFPNRFAAPDSQVNDFNRPFVYPREEFVPGWMNVLEVQVQGHSATTKTLALSAVPERCALGVSLRTPLPPGAMITVSVRFQTGFPYRFGTFGEFDEMLTAIGGWYPYLAPLRSDGTWAVDELPGLADFDVQLTVDPDMELWLNGQGFERSSAPLHAVVPGVHYLSLVVAPALLHDEIQAGPTRVIFVHQPRQLASRISAESSELDNTLAALRDIVLQRPPGIPDHHGDLVVVAAPLRLRATAAAEGMVVISDRAFKVLWLLRPFHQLQVAQAVYAELLRSSLDGRESGRDYGWVGEGLSYVLARRHLAITQPRTRSVQDWIERFNIFAIVDRFETAPKIPFVESFFERARTLDALHEEISTFNNDLPPGHVILGKLRQLVGDAAFEALIDRCLAADLPFRVCAARESGGDLGWFFGQWLQPYPDINYELDGLRLNERHDDSFQSAVTVRRRAGREIHEPVDVRLRSIAGQDVDLRWDGSGDQARLTAVTSRRVYQAIIDPERKLIETTRADNASPPSPQIVLDSAEVEITSTEFGFSGLVVGRGRYDYRKDLAVAAFYTDRGVGVDVGGRYHWGMQNDANSYRHNLYAFYDVQALDSSFLGERTPTLLRTRGHVNGLGLRYDYNNIVAYDNPTHEVNLRLFADWYDRALGSGFDYVNWGGSLVLTHPLWTHRTILAGEVLNGFSEPLGSSVVPNQTLFSLGGSRSIRGIGAQDELARNILLLRGELRQAVYPELDLNLFDVLVLRRTQVRLFVDTGQVSNSAGAMYDPAGYAVGVGCGFAAVYEFMGFFPSLAYIEIATRVDRPSKAGDVQFLFGTRQAF